MELKLQGAVYRPSTAPQSPKPTPDTDSKVRTQTFQNTQRQRLLRPTKVPKTTGIHSPVMPLGLAQPLPWF